MDAKVDWWVYRKTAGVAHAVPLEGTRTEGGKKHIHNGVALCGLEMWIYASVAGPDVKHCPKCRKAEKRLTDAVRSDPAPGS